MTVLFLLWLKPCYLVHILLSMPEAAEELILGLCLHIKTILWGAFERQCLVQQCSAHHWSESI